MAALAHPAPRRILVLGGSVERHRPRTGQHAPGADGRRGTGSDVRRGVADRPSSDVVVADRRRFLTIPRETSSAGSAPFDLIVVAMPQPTSGQSNRFYTAEFFDECRQRLARRRRRGASARHARERGDAARRAAGGERRRGRCARRFRHLELLQGTIAHRDRLGCSRCRADAGPLVDRWQSRGLTARLVTPAYLRYLFQNDRRASLQPPAGCRRRRRTPTRGRCATRSPRRAGWRSSSRRCWASSHAALAVRAARSAGPALGARPVAVAHPLRAGALARAARAALLAGVAGFSGMLLETVLLLAYQAQERRALRAARHPAHGVHGGTGGRRLERRTSPGSPAPRRATCAWSPPALLAASAVLGVLTVALVATGAAMGLVLTGVMLCRRRRDGGRRVCVRGGVSAADAGKRGARPPVRRRPRGRGAGLARRRPGAGADGGPRADGLARRRPQRDRLACLV